ncbi:hypothetical protein GCM10007315_04290 [Gemmobacter tilapiae]|uniref:Uncharacterized protein n=1 Tax=Neogemmobacter tilapiae TaxID=875041 RepID=A0A918THY2_9RHOB|nr:hypothetical protein GCM10007315_04290 [Gemmobacter tilapiae]
MPPPIPNSPASNPAKAPIANSITNIGHKVAKSGIGRSFFAHGLALHRPPRQMRISALVFTLKSV